MIEVLFAACGVVTVKKKEQEGMMAVNAETKRPEENVGVDGVRPVDAVSWVSEVEFGPALIGAGLLLNLPQILVFITLSALYNPLITLVQSPLYGLNYWR